MLNGQIITSTNELADACALFAQSDFVALDTEFIREKTYFPQLCLLQMGNEQGAVAVDPLAEGIDLAPLFALLANENVVKVFHAGRQDLEIFYQLTSRIPAPIFDSQIAASACGYGESIGYEALVSRMLGKTLDKGARFTDWSKRPLSERQLAYALSDVIYLCDIYRKQQAHLAKHGRGEWVEGEMNALADIGLYDADPADAWKRLKCNSRKPRVLAALRELAKWRELEARRINVPRGRIIRDELLVEVALSLPKTLEELKQLRGVERGLSANTHKALLDAMQTALNLPESELPQVKAYARGDEPDKAIVAMLQLLLEVKAHQHQVTPRMIITRDELDRLALGDENSPVFTGWRYDVYGKDAKLLLAGKLTLSLSSEYPRRVIVSEQD